MPPEDEVARAINTVKLAAREETFATGFGNLILVRYPNYAFGIDPDIEK